MLKPTRKKIVDVLKFLNKRLNKVKWVLVGSTSLMVQGVDVFPHDIDILTSKRDIRKIEKLLEKHEIKRLRYKISEIFRSYFCIFRIKGIKVEVMSNLEVKIGNRWKKFRVLPQEIEFKGMKFLVSPLKDELRIRKKLRRKVDLRYIKKIEKHLKK